MKHKGLIFDLDGVLVNTAKYHYLAWKQLADELGIPFTEADNERFKGVSRMTCMNILLDLGHKTMSEEEKVYYANKKNDILKDYISKLDESEVFPGVKNFLQDARDKGYLISLGSASKNAPMILERLNLTSYFDQIVDGTTVSKAKPDPEVFLQGAKRLGVPPVECIVFEDAVAGIEAAHAGDMAAVGVGSKELLPEADINILTFDGITIDNIECQLDAAYRKIGEQMASRYLL